MLRHPALGHVWVRHTPPPLEMVVPRPAGQESLKGAVAGGPPLALMALMCVRACVRVCMRAW